MPESVTPGRTLLMLSGGIDSALCMYQALTAGRDLAVHHIRLVNHEGRQDVEDAATSKIVAWHRQNGLDGFTFTRSTFDYGTLRFIVKDAAVWAFLIAVVLADPKNRDIGRVIIPRHLDAFGHVADPARAAARSDRLLAGMTQLVAGRVPEFEHPIGQFRKPAIIAATPPDLLACCWWCRKPQSGRPCHRCITCVQVDPVLKEREPA